MRGAEKKKAISAGVLMLIAAVGLYSAFSPSAPATAPAPSKRESVMDTLANGDAASKAGTAKRPKGSLMANADPTLRLDLIQRLQATRYEGSNRNIFQFYTPPAPPIPPIDHSVEIARQQQNRPLDTPPPPRPPDPIPLKFYGLASAPGVAPRKAFLQQEDEIFIAMEGDLVKKRYKVVKINETSIEMEDIQNSSKQKLPLQES